MNMLAEQDILKMSQIFTPENAEKLEKLNSNKTRLAHYTSAENAISIIKNQEIWLRNARAMDDFSEVGYGFDQLKQYFDAGTNKQVFLNALGVGHPAIKDGITKFDNWWASTHGSTYIACFSEHHKKDDDHGRLSMWRAFSQPKPGVALIFNPPQPNSALPLKVFLSPVAYYSIKELTISLDNVVNQIKLNSKYLLQFPSELITEWVYMLLVSAAVSLKHPGFGEEEEWRMIHLPDQIPSSFMKPSTETVRSVPQLVYKIKLKNDPQNGINDIEILNIMDSILIGPTQYPLSIHGALVHELLNIGIQNPQNFIKISGIPIRS